MFPDLPPAVVVHGLPHALLVLRRQRPVCLLSAPAAGRYAGVAWWRAMIDAAVTGSGNNTACDVLDCGNAPGAAMAALRHGQRRLILDPDCPAFAAIAATATSVGASLLDRRPKALDLAKPGAERGLSAWLSGPRGDSDPGLE